MEKPKYKLDFEIDAYYQIKEDIKVKMPDGSLFILYPSTKTNKGSIIFQTDTLNEDQARKEAESKVNEFIDFWIVSSSIDSIGSLRFTNGLQLLNPEKFRGKTRTVSKNFTLCVDLVAVLKKDEVHATMDLISRSRKLNSQEQNAINKCLSWFRKSSEVAGEEKFIYRWISLEALCGFLSEVSSTKTMLNTLLHNKLKIDSAKAIIDNNKNTIDELIKANLIGWKGARPSENLKKMVKKNADAKTIVSKAVLCVLEVRNSLFHKGEVLSLLEGCSSLLRDVIGKTVMDILIG